MFFTALSKFGTDFNVIAAAEFPNRSRKQIKRKFQNEERVRPAKVRAALELKAKAPTRDGRHYKEAHECLKRDGDNPQAKGDSAHRANHGGDEGNAS